MPFIDDYSDDQEDHGPGGGGGSRLTGGSAGVQANPSPQKEASFTPWSRFVSANQDVSDREAGKLQSGVQGDVDRAVSTRDTAASAQANDINSNYSGYKPPPSSQLSNPQALNLPTAATSFTAGKQTPNGITLGAGPAPLPHRERPYRAAGLPDPVKTINPDRLQTDVSSGKPVTKGSGIVGAKDLEAQLGSSAWGSLVGDTAKAQNEAGALGSESGVQGLIQQQTAQPLAQNGAFDAALINGAGANGFQELSKKYGDNSLSKGLVDANAAAQSRWSKLMGDVDSGSKARDKEITDATAEMNHKAQEQSQRDADGAANQKKLQEQLDYLKQHFPIAPQFDTQDGFVNWIAQSRNGPNGPNGQAGFSNVSAWADQIYGPGDPKNPYKNVDQFFADVRRMTPAEYEAFKYGVVPAWMGQGGKASGANGGSFWGLGNTGNRVTGTTTDTPTAENQQDWEQKQQALKAYYQILAAIASAG